MKEFVQSKKKCLGRREQKERSRRGVDRNSEFLLIENPQGRSVVLQLGNWNLGGLAVALATGILAGN